MYQSLIQSDNSIESYAAHDLQTDRQTHRQTDRQTDRRTDRQTDTFVKTLFRTQGVSKRKDLMKFSKVIFHIKPIPSHP